MNQKLITLSIVLILLIAITPSLIIAQTELSDETTAEITTYNPEDFQQFQEQFNFTQEDIKRLGKIVQIISSLIIAIIVLSIIELILKGFAMWRAAKKDSKVWFWLILIFNTLGILPLIYLLVTKPAGKEKKKPANKPTKKAKKKKK